MEVYDVVKKLIGPIEPIGETNSDNKRYSNLVDTIDLVDELVSDINRVAACTTCHEYSMNKAGKRAEQFLKDIKEW